MEAGQESIIQGVGRIQTTEDIAKTVIVVRDGRPIRVSDLGAVTIGAAIKRGTGWASRRGPNREPIIEPGVIMAGLKQPGANTLEVAGRLDEALDEIQPSVPLSMAVNKNLFRQAAFIKAQRLSMCDNIGR
ncbi:MAG: efflux RND transporter permease subunit [Phycisphaerae bacterium]